jgi:hypothetical protein
MAKKKTAAVKKRTTASVRRVSVSKTAKAKSRATVKKGARTVAVRKTVKAKQVRGVKKKSAAQSLGRPRVPVDAELALVFQKDYQAREIFAFLGVHTIRELEQFGPQEIIDRLAGPMVQTVNRIRKALALSNRSLAGDRQFAADFQREFKAR